MYALLSWRKRWRREKGNWNQVKGALKILRTYYIPCWRTEFQLAWNLYVTKYLKHAERKEEIRVVFQKYPSTSDLLWFLDKSLPFSGSPPLPVINHSVSIQDAFKVCFVTAITIHAIKENSCMFSWKLIWNQIIARTKRFISVTRLSPKPVRVNPLNLRMFEWMA